MTVFLVAFTCARSGTKELSDWAAPFTAALLEVSNAIYSYKTSGLNPAAYTLPPEMILVTAETSTPPVAAVCAVTESTDASTTEAYTSRIGAPRSIAPVAYCVVYFS